MHGNLRGSQFHHKNFQQKSVDDEQERSLNPFISRGDRDIGLTPTVAVSTKDKLISRETPLEPIPLA
jgi:hypothetical protein